MPASNLWFVPRTQLERTRATTEQLVEAARQLFATHGYEQTSLDAIVEKAGVTKGAMYHHFESKQELFAAVYAREQRKLADAVESAARPRRDAWEAVLAGCQAFFESSLDPATLRITLLDAPGALGWQRMRSIESDYSTALLRRGLEAAMASGQLAKRPLEPLTYLLLGAMCEAAMMAARAANPRQEARLYLRELRTLLNSIRD